MRTDWHCTGNIIHQLEWDDKVKLYHVTNWDCARTHYSSCYLLFQQPLVQCQLDSWVDFYAVTIPGQASRAGPTASTQTVVTVSPRWLWRYMEMTDKRKFPSPHSCLYVPFLLQMTLMQSHFYIWGRGEGWGGLHKYVVSLILFCSMWILEMLRRIAVLGVVLWPGPLSWPLVLWRRTNSAACQMTYKYQNQITTVIHYRKLLCRLQSIHIKT